MTIIKVAPFTGGIPHTHPQLFSAHTAAPQALGTALEFTLIPPFIISSLGFASAVILPQKKAHPEDYLFSKQDWRTCNVTYSWF